jgi:hypothetical protein
VAVELNVALEAAGSHWLAKTVDLSPYGVKVALPADSVSLPPGTRAELKLAVPGQNSAVSLAASVVRTDPDGIGLNFIDLSAQQFARLKDVVDSLLQSFSKDRRRSPRVEPKMDISFDAEEPNGWRGSKIVNLSPFGMKVALPAAAIQPAWGTSVQLHLTGPNGQPPVSVKGIVWRNEPQSMALMFVELGRDQVDRLQALVKSVQT